ncbi:hypothetical protein [Pandoraea sputorum]|uniref:hypothetical protein n=1 Tax=Pandoraea sputorum TaxID=93222 RepID=UPI002F3EF06D
MTKQFKIGDRVRCVSESVRLKRGAVYTIAGHTGIYVQLLETGRTDYYASRFELAEEPYSPPPPFKFKKGDRVRCVGRGSNRYITVGSEYTVADAGEFTVLLVQVPHTRYDIGYFELIPATPKCFRILRKGVQWGTTEYGSVEDAEAAIQKSAPIGEPFVIVELTTVKAVTVKRVLEAA